MIVEWYTFFKRMEAVGQIPPSNEGKYTRGRELLFVQYMARPYNGRALAEIGTNKGYTAVALAKTCPDSMVYTFDICRELVGDTASPCDGEIEVRENVGVAIAGEEPSVRDRIHSIVSHPAFLRGEIVKFKPYGLVFIDGDHTWRSVVEDTKVALDSIEEGGTLVWDDFSWNLEIQSAINIVNMRCGDVITHVRGTRMCYVKLDAKLLRKMRSAVSDL